MQDQDFSFDVVAQKSIRGIFALVSRSFFITLVGTAVGFILAGIVSPAIYGVYFVVSSIIVFLNYFQDIGLAASLIQKKEEPTLAEYRTVFTVQQIIVLGISIPTLFFSSVIASWNNLEREGWYLLVALVVSFILSSLRTIPTVMLERRLEFNRLVIPQILENLFYSITLIVFAVLDFGVMSFTYAVIVRSVVGLVSTYIIQPWRVGYGWDKDGLKKLISFGIPFQANSVLALLKDDLLTIYIARIVPISEVGMIGFAQKMAFAPLRLIMDNVIKVTFPSFSRLQHDREGLRIAIEKSLFLISLTIFPAVACLALLSKPFLEFFPFKSYSQWIPATVSVAFFALNSMISSISTPLTNFLNSIGKVKVTLYFMIFWTIAIWVLTPICVFLFGFNGVAIASFLVSLSSISVFFVTRKYIYFSFVDPCYKQLIATVCMAGFIFISSEMANSFFTLVIQGSIALVLYFMIVFALAKNEILSTIKFIIISVRKVS